MLLGGLVGHLMEEALWALMHINKIRCYHILTPLFPMEEKHCAFKRPSYTSIAVLVPCMSLRHHLIAISGSLNMLYTLQSFHDRVLTSSCMYSFSPSSKFTGNSLLGHSTVPLLWWLLLFITRWCWPVSLLAFYTITGIIELPWRYSFGLIWLLFWELIAFPMCYLLQYSCPLLGYLITFPILCFLLSPCGHTRKRTENSILVTKARMTLVGVLIGIPETYTPAKSEVNQTNSLGEIWAFIIP